MENPHEASEVSELPTDLMGRVDLIIFSLFLISLVTLSCTGWIDLRSQPGWASRLLWVILFGVIIVSLPKAVLDICWAIAMPDWVRRCREWIHDRPLQIGILLVLLAALLFLVLTAIHDLAYLTDGSPLAAFWFLPIIALLMLTTRIVRGLRQPIRAVRIEVHLGAWDAPNDGPTHQKG